MGHLAKNVLLSLVHNPVTAATTAANSSWVDMQNYEGCMFMGTIGAGTTSQEITVQYAASTTASGSALSGAEVTVAGNDDNKGWAIDVHAPHSRGRYLRTSLSGSTGAGVLDWGGVLALRYNGRSRPKSSTGLIDGDIDLVVVQTT